MSRIKDPHKKASFDVETIKQKGSNYNIVYKRHFQASQDPDPDRASNTDKCQPEHVDTARQTKPLPKRPPKASPKAAVPSPGHGRVPVQRSQPTQEAVPAPKQPPKKDIPKVPNAHRRIAEAPSSRPEHVAVRDRQRTPKVSSPRIGLPKRPVASEAARPVQPVQEAKPVDYHPHGIDPNLVVYHDPASVEAEIFKVLRNNILFPKEGAPPPLIMVTSAMPGDGKSFVAANLSISIAKGIEDYVLLMDCDMRRSSIHQKFGFEDNLPGLSDYLSKEIPLQALLKKTIVDKLTILPGGRISDNPSELLSSQRMKNLLEEARGRYKDRFVIIDSPPPKLTSETTALAKYVDGILIVIRYGVTAKSAVEELVENLGREKILGIVLNGYHIPATERYGYGRYNLTSYKQR